MALSRSRTWPLQSLVTHDAHCELIVLNGQIHGELRRGFQSGKAKSIAYRKEQLLQLAYLIHDNRQRFRDAFLADLGRPADESDLYVCSRSPCPVRSPVCVGWRSTPPSRRRERRTRTSGNGPRRRRRRSRTYGSP